MGGQMYGYARVSTKHQNEDRQMIALQAYGIPKENIVIEKRSGKDFDRPLYRDLVNRLEPGDVLVVKSVDRLGRNYSEILEEWRRIVRERELNVVVLDMPILNTVGGKEETGLRLLIVDLTLTMVSYFAQAEREQIHQRQMEGIAAAKRRGVTFGRPRIQLPDDFNSIAARWQSGEITGRAAAKLLNVSHTTFFRWMREMNIQKNPDGPGPMAPDPVSDSQSSAPTAPEPVPAPAQEQSAASAETNAAPAAAQCQRQRPFPRIGRQCPDRAADAENIRPAAVRRTDEYLRETG